MPEKSLQEFLEAEDFEEDPNEAAPATKAKSLRQIMQEEGAEPVEDSPIRINRTITPNPSVFSQVPVPAAWERSPNDPMVIAANAGVDFMTGTQFGHFLAGFAIDEENKRLAYDMSINDVSSQPVRTRIGPATEQIEYLNPETRRWTLVNSLSSDRNDLKRAVGPSVALGLEVIFTAGAVGVGAVSGGTGGVVLFSMAQVPATVLAEGTRLWMGNQLGVNQNVSAGEVSAHLATVGAISAGAGLAGEAGIRSAMAFYRWLGLDVSTRQLVREFGMDLTEAARIQDEINRKVVGAEFRLRLGQASGVEDILAVEKQMERSLIFAGDMAQQKKQQQLALRAYFEKLNEPYISSAGGSKVAAGRGVQGAAGKPVVAGQQNADILVDVKRAELDNLVMGVRDAPGENLGTPLRGFIDGETNALRTWADEVMEEFDIAVGDVRVRPSQTSEYLAALDKKVEDSLIPMQRKEIISIIGERETAKAGGDAQLVLDKGGLLEWEEQADEIVLGLRNGDSEFTVDQIWNALKSLKRAQRRAGSPGAELMDTAVVDGLIDALQRDLRASLTDVDPVLTSVYDDFITKYATETTRLRRGAIGRIMDIDPSTKKPFIEDPRVFDELFHKQKGLVEPAEQLYQTIKGNPELMQTTRQSIARHWKDFAFNDDGKLLVRKHKQWLQDYGPAAKKFMNADEWAAITSAKDVADEIAKREVRREAMYKEINAGLEAQIYNRKRPDTLINDMLVKGEDEFAGQVMQILRKYGDDETILMVQDAVRRRFVDDVTLPRGPRDYEFNLNAFRKLLYKDANIADNLRVIMGDQYVDDLFVLGDALEMASRESAAMFNPSGTAGAAGNRAIMDLTRAYVGLFTRAGRVVTAANRIRGRAANTMLLRAVANPGDLRELMRLAEIHPFDPRWARFAGSVGAAGLLLEADVPPPPQGDPIEFPGDQ